MDASSSSREKSSVPTGLRVLVVDDDNISLFVLKMCLLKCGYHVTTCTRGAKALSLLRENKGAYDLVMLDVHMPGMNGLQVLETIGLEMDIPVLMVSGDSNADTVMEGLMHGACDYLVKPSGVEQVRFIWKHVVQRRIVRKNKRKRDVSDVSDGNDSDDEDCRSSKKKTRVWNAELHQKFVEAVKEIGIDKAAPKKILEKMRVPGLYKSQVASHLQKFRNFVKKTFAARMPNQIPEDVVDKFSAQTLGSSSSVAEQPAAGASTATVPSWTGPINTQLTTSSQALDMTSNQNPDAAAETHVSPVHRTTTVPSAAAEGHPSGTSFTKLLQLVESSARQVLVPTPASDTAPLSVAANQNPDAATNRGKEVIVCPAGEGTSAGANAGWSSPVCGFSDDDEILQEDYLVRLFNSSTDDAFL